MLKQTITYKDFDDKTVTEDLYFNLTKTDLMDNMQLKEELEALGERLGTEERDLTIEETQLVLNMVKKLMKLSYGVRSADGRKFTKKGVWDDFEDTAVYDAFLWSLFEVENKALAFMKGVLPEDIRQHFTNVADQTALDIPELQAAPPILVDDKKEAEKLLEKETPVDVDALLAEMPDEEPEPEKTPISSKQFNFLKNRLSEQQITELLKTRVVVD